MGRILNLLKESLASSAMDMDMSRENVLIYLRMNGKAYATTLSDSESSNSDSEDSFDEEGNFSAFMTIAHVESSEDLNLFV